jgi:hypothetical protein
MSAKKSSKLSTADAKQQARSLQFMVQTTIIDSLKRRGQSGRLGKQYGDKRDLYNVLGYLPIPGVEDYWQMFLRQDIAKRVIKAPAIATWRNPPLIQETKSPNVTTKFEAAFEALAKRLKLWSYMKRLDVLAGVGYYGVMLLGVRTAGKLEQAIAASSFKGPEDLMFLSVFSQRHAQVKEFGADPKIADYGQPINYNIDLSGDIANSQGRATAQAIRSKVRTSGTIEVVDASRILHFAEDLTEDEVNGTPRLEPVINRMFDIEKVAGGSAEMYWRGAYGGFALEVADGSTGAFAQSSSASDFDPAIIDEFAHGMRRWIDLEGYKLKEIQGQDVKPAEVFTMLIQLVSSATSVPQRILLGSERGELSSSQDERNWNDFIVDRRTELATPKIRELIDRWISWGILPAPATDYEVVWPPVATPTPKEKAETFQLYAQGIAAVSPAGAPDMIITPAEVRTKFLDLPAEPAMSSEDIALPDEPVEPPVPAPAPRPVPTPAARRAR